MNIFNTLTFNGSIEVFEMSLALLLRRNNNLKAFFANVTQLAERQPSKLEVVGSNPIIRFFTKYK